MDLPGQNKSVATTSKISSVFAFLLLVLVMVGVACIAYLKSNDVDIKNIKVSDLLEGKVLLMGVEEKESKVTKIDYDPKDHPAFSVYKGYIVKSISNSIRFIDENGEIILEKSLPISNPIIKTNGIELLIADAGAKELYLLKDKEVKWNIKMDSNIINADISQSGYVTVVHEAKGYKGAVTVLNLQGEKLFTRNMAEGFVISAGVSPKAKQVLLNTLDTSGIKANSALELTDMIGEPVGEKINIEDAIFPSIVYLENESIVAVSSSLVLNLGKEGKEKWRVSFTDREIFGSCMLDGKNVIVAVSGEEKSGGISNNSTQIVVFDTNGKYSPIYSVGDTVRNIEAKDTYVAVNTGREVHFITYKGKLIHKYSSKLDVVEVRFLDNQEAVIITKNSVEVLKIG